MSTPNPPSPWQGSEHIERHGWELDDATSLLDAAAKIEAIANELETAHKAGWWLASPMQDGRLHAHRLSRRQRAQVQQTGVTPTDLPATAPELPVRIRIVDEPPQPDWPVLTFDSARCSPWLAARDAAIEHVAGPEPAAEQLLLINGQVSADELGRRRWAIASARVGPGVDLVAGGSALRAHAVIEDVVVRTTETLILNHAADRCATLPEAAAAYRRLAHAVIARVEVGGVMDSVDDGFIVVRYDNA